MPHIESPSPTGEVSGITLHVEQSGEQPATVLTYHKAQSPTIAVGRKPTQVKDGAVETFVDRALFKCPVVSRKHAKITFTEFGNAYITDLNSHHGTHILRPGESISKTIEPNTPAVLADGDLVTFGKTVGRDEMTVHPVVAKVSLVIMKDDREPNGPDSQLEVALEKPSPRPGTGRYAVPSSSSSSDMSCSEDEDEADDHSAISSSPSATASRGSFAPLISYEMSGRLAFLRRILPPVHSLSADPRVREAVSAIPDETASTSNIAPDSARTIKSFFIEDLPPPPNWGRALSWPAPSIGAYPASASPSRPSSPSSDMQPSDGPTSPEPLLMKLRSSPFQEYDYSLVNMSEDEESAEGSQPGMAQASIEPHQDENELTPAELDEVILEYYSHPPDNAPVLPGMENVHTVIAELCAPQDRSDRSDQIADLSNRVDVVCCDLDELRRSRSDNEVHFREQLQDVKTRMDGLRNHMDVNLMTTIRANASLLADYSVRVEEMQRQMDMQKETVEKAMDAEAETGKVAEMRALLQEVKAIRDASMQDLTIQLEAIQNARIEAEQIIAASMYEVRNELKSSRKRKVSDIEEPKSSISTYNDDSPLPATKRRRIKRIVSGIGKTAVVATVGAAAAWTALAFA